MKLIELATIVRSKNAGPATLTLDVFFPSDEAFALATRAAALAPASIARLYGCDVSEVARYELPAIRALKISVPRKIVAGSPGDGDAYGAQQHGPLLQLEL